VAARNGPGYDRQRMDAAEQKIPGKSGKGTPAVVAAVVLFVVVAAGWAAWQLRGEESRQASRVQEKAFAVTPVARPGPAPAVLGTTVEGKPFTLAEARGQVVFVNFWATWCPPCRDEMPSMLQLGRDLAARHPGKFRMVAVTVDDGWPEVLKFFDGKLPSGIDVVHDPEQKATRDYYCQARGACPESFKFPETYVVDASGKLVSYVVGPRDWNDPAARAFLERLIP
jgi:thiol-disulfide isomerase/thioredoxin